MKTVNGTSYHDETPDLLVRVLEDLRESRARITLDYGDVKTGKSWDDVYDISGRIGRSTGLTKIPLLVHNARSMGGGGILDHCILSIRYANKRDGGVIYKRSAGWK